MMCTCCAAPVAAGMRKQQVSMGGALAFWMGNPLLNPATLVFMGFVLGWQFALVRPVAGGDSINCGDAGAEMGERGGDAAGSGACCTVGSDSGRLL